MDRPPLLRNTAEESEDDSLDGSGDDNDESSSDDDGVGRSARTVFIEENLQQFPCTFNIGRANCNFGGLVFNLARIHAPSCRYVNWGIFIEKVITGSHDDHWEPLTWLQNLRIRAFIELGHLEEARSVINEILYRTDDQNITTMANLAVLHFVEGNVQAAQNVVVSLNEQSRLRSFRFLKADAVCEQAYCFYVLSGAFNNISGIELLNFVLRERCIKDRTEAVLMLGTLYRRCLHWNTYEFAKDKIDFCVFAQRAYENLDSVRHDREAKLKLKANALIELAFLQHDIARARDVDVQALHFEDSVENLCNEAVSIAPVSAKVTAIAGQLLKHIPRMASRAKYLLEKSLEIRPSARVFHHLGLMLLNEAREFENRHAAEVAMNHNRETSTFNITKFATIMINNNLEIPPSIIVGDEYFSWDTELFDDSDNLPQPPRDIELLQEDRTHREVSQPQIQLPNSIDWALDSILAEGRNIPSYSCNNPYIQNAKEYLIKYFHLSDLEHNLPTVTQLGFAYMKCRQYALAFYVFETFHFYDTDEVPGIILAYGYKMLTFCTLLNADIHESLVQKRFMRELGACFFTKAVSRSANIPDDEASRLEPRVMLDIFRDIPPFHKISARKFPTLRN